MRSPAAALALVIAACVGLRVWVLTSAIGRLNADEAVTGVMAQRILGGEWFTYYPPQPYMGALEQYLQAGVLAVLPDGPLTLRLAQVALSGLTCGLTYALGRRVTGSAWAGVLAAALFALGPFHSVVWGTRSLGAYLAAQAVGVIGALIALALEPGGRRAVPAAAGFGLCLGLGLWLNVSAFFMLIPAAVWVAGSMRGHVRRLLPWTALGAAVGALPFLVFQLRHGFADWTGYPQPPSSVLDRLHGLVDPLLGMFLGVRQPYSGQAETGTGMAWLVTVAALAGLAAALWVRRRGLLDLVLLRAGGRRRPLDVLLVALVLAGVGYVVSSYGWFTGEPRYLFAVYPALAVALAAAVHRTGRPAPAVGAAALALTALLFAISADRDLDAGGGGGFVEGVRVEPGGLGRVADAMRREGIRSVYADYWLAYPLQFAAGDRLQVAATTYVRFPGAVAAADRDPSPAFAAPVGLPADRIAAALERRGARYRRQDVEGVAIFSRVRPRQRPQDLDVWPPWGWGYSPPG